jgi:formyltetrahydrofolate hydrolase
LPGPRRHRWQASNFLASHGWITEASHHSDNLSGWFHVRSADSLPFDRGFREAFALLPKSFDGLASLICQKKRVVLMATNHCLADLLHRCTATNWIAKSRVISTMTTCSMVGGTAFLYHAGQSRIKNRHCRSRIGQTA